MAGAMHVATLTLTNFRNHAATRIEAGPGFVVLTGDNGAGKTNILEAVSLLSPGRGLRGVALDELPRDAGGGQDRGGFAIASQCRSNDAGEEPVSIGTAVEPDQPGRRRVRINGSDVAATALAEWLSVLWLTPAMDRLFTDAAGQRRRFLDRMVMALSPRHARVASQYETAMRSRTRLLTGDAPTDPQWLDALEQQMADHGAALDAARHQLVGHLAERTAAEAQTLFARPDIALVDATGAPAEPWQALRLAAALRDGRGRDAVAGRALAGPHRADLSVVHSASGQAAARCSTGEQKALLLSIVLAHGDIVAEQRSRRPLLLLDEIAAHLDPARRRTLFERLAQSGGQVWMTGTEAGLFADVPEPASRWVVRGGTASPG